MIDAKTIALEARLLAMELSIGQAHALIQSHLGITAEQQQAAYEGARTTLEQHSVPGVPAEMSDHYAAELRDAVVRLQIITQAFLAVRP